MCGPYCMPPLPEISVLKFGTGMLQSRFLTNILFFLCLSAGMLSNWKLVFRRRKVWKGKLRRLGRSPEVDIRAVLRAMPTWKNFQMATGSHPHWGPPCWSRHFWIAIATIGDRALLWPKLPSYYGWASVLRAIILWRCMQWSLFEHIIITIDRSSIIFFQIVQQLDIAFGPWSCSLNRTWDGCKFLNYKKNIS
jgi:hypothetical protein